MWTNMLPIIETSEADLLLGRLLNGKGMRNVWGGVINLHVKLWLFGIVVPF